MNQIPGRPARTLTSVALIGILGAAGPVAAQELVRAESIPVEPGRAAGVEAAPTRSDAPEVGESVAVSPDIRVSALANGVWLHTSWYTYPGGARVSSNGLLVREGGELLLVDTAWGEHPTEELLEWVASHLGLPVSRAIVTHAHHDRIGGSAALERRGIPVLAHPETRRLALEHGLPVPEPLAGLEEVGSVAALGAAEVLFPGAGHAPDNLMLWLPEHRILFGGCAVRDASTDTLGNVAHADTLEWPRAIGRALDRYGTAEQVVPGHGEVGGRDLLEHTRSLFR